MQIKRPTPTPFESLITWQLATNWIRAPSFENRELPHNERQQDFIDERESDFSAKTERLNRPLKGVLKTVFITQIGDDLMEIRGYLLIKSVGNAITEPFT